MELIGDLFQVTLAGLLLGAGLPLIYALAIRLSVPKHGVEDNASDHVSGLQRGVAGALYLVIVAAVVIGLLWITQGRLYDAFGWDIFGTGGSSGH
jgi:hypothetical protein